MSTVSRVAADPRFLAQSPARPTILCLSTDAAEQAEYATVFRKAGWAVTQARSVEQGAGLLTSNRYSAVVVAASVALSDQFAMANIARNEFGVPVLVVCNGFIEPNLPCDALLSSSERHRVLYVLQRLTARAA